MTERQQRIVRFISAYHAEHGRGPSQRLIGRALGIKSAGSLCEQLQLLADYGHLARLPDGTGRYVPASAPRGVLTDVPTAALEAELARRAEGGAP